MLFRVIFLLFFSSAALSAGVTIDVDLEMTIDQIEYVNVEPDNADSPVTSSIVTDHIASSWNNIEATKQGLDSFQAITVTHPNSRAGVLVELSNREIEILYKDNTLNVIELNVDGSQDIGIYPEIPNDFESYGLLNGVPYILDIEADTIWQWDTDYWRDLAATQTLPAGEYQSVLSYGSNYLLSTEDEIEGGLWQVGLTNQQLSNVTWPSNSSLIGTPIGLLQFYKGSANEVVGHWLESNAGDFTLGLNIDDYPFVRGTATDGGIMLAFYGAEPLKLFWLPTNPSANNSISEIEIPFNWRSFNWCHSAYPKAFCVMDVQDVGYALYEVIDGEFVLDSILNEAFSGKSINGIYAIGEHRFISAYYNGVGDDRSYLYAVNGTGVEMIMSVERSSTDDPYYLLPSRDEGIFYWIGKELGRTQLYKGYASGDFIFKRNVDASQQVDDPVEESDDSSESSGGGGSMPSYLLAMLLMLLIPRVRSYPVSGV
ncbi:MAG: hypothetical protein V7785_17695 [Bermanella sp.]